jgi:Yip1 domain
MQVQSLEMNVKETNKYKKPSLLKMVWQPVEQFEKIKAKPVILFALFTITFLYTLGAAAMALNYDVNSILTEVPDVENNPVLFKSILIGSAALSGLATPLFNILVTSALFYIVAKLFKSSVSFRQLFSMNTHVMMIGVIGLLFNSLLLHTFNIDGIQTVTSLASFGENPILAKIEVFAIWQTVLTGVGLYHVANFSKVLSWVITTLLFIAIIASGLMFSNVPIAG